MGDKKAALVFRNSRTQTRRETGWPAQDIIVHGPYIRLASGQAKVARYDSAISAWVTNDDERWTDFVFE